jgi:hypothetical protein
VKDRAEIWVQLPIWWSRNSLRAPVIVAALAFRNGASDITVVSIEMSRAMTEPMSESGVIGSLSTPHMYLCGVAGCVRVCCYRRCVTSGTHTLTE